jgi:1-acyl-sn-glycerol-3-phosphate acyltransferase
MLGGVGLLYSALRATLRLGLRAFFHEIEVHGLENVPTEGPCVVAANHQNSMMDPALLVAASPRPLSFIAKAPLFRVPILGWILRGTGCIPAHRSQDPGYAKEKNEALYEAAARALASPSALAVFPEGKSHSGPELAELRHGASRIALEAETRRGGVRILPAGLHFEESRGFRGRSLLQFGPALPLEGWKERFAADPRAATAALTEELRKGLSDMILAAESHEILRLAELVREMDVLRRGEPADLKGEFDRRKFILDSYRELRGTAPSELAALVLDLTRYRRTLGLLGLRDEDVSRDYRPGRILAHALGRTLLLALGLPVVAGGIVLHFPPYFLSWCAGRLLARAPDQRAGAAFMTALLLFPAAWAGLGYAGWRLAGPAGAAAAVGGAAAAGALALRWMDAWHRLLGEAWALWTAVARPAARASLRRIRARALARVERLAAATGGAPPPPGTATPGRTGPGASG